MKVDFKKVGVILIIVLQIILWTAIVSFKSPEPAPASYQLIMTIDRYTNVYKLSIDGEQYILVSGSNSSMSLIKAY